MHAEEVAVKERGISDLIDRHFGCEGEDLGRIVEMVAEEDEPGRYLVKSFAVLEGEQY